MDCTRWLRPLVLAVGLASLFVGRSDAAETGAISSDEGVSFRDTFRCTADGTDQSIVIQLPRGHSPDGSYPLLIHLSFGLPNVDSLDEYDKPYVKVHATGHRLLAYLGLVEQDVLAIIEKMRRSYGIDERRVPVR